MCLHFVKYDSVELLCIDKYPGIKPYNGLGQLSPEQLASRYNNRLPLTEDQFLFALQVDRSFSMQNQELFKELATYKSAPLPWIPSAISRWLEEQPDKKSGLGRLEQNALKAIHTGCNTAKAIYSYVAAMETLPQFWGDTTLWEKINHLADMNPPLIKIEGPGDRLPQWHGKVDINLFKIYPI
jgi:hypothetical protein